MKKSTEQFKQARLAFHQRLADDFRHGKHIGLLTEELTRYTDKLLIELWQELKLESACLIALGSYGRQEPQLYSDLDLLILYPELLDEHTRLQIESFIQKLWDIGFKLGHQISAPNDFADIARGDITVISNLLDMRMLSGNAELFEELRYFIHPSQMWQSNKYFQAKWKEQLLRHKKYGESAYQLEPNIKNSPGGLRDLQMINWVAQRHFRSKTLYDQLELGFLNNKEYHSLLSCQHFLWQVRFALHMLAGKQEDRLLFDYQKNIASLLGYEDSPHKLAIEKFMNNYFAVIKTLRELNDMLLQLFREAIVRSTRPKITSLNSYFQICNRYIELKPNVSFSDHPSALLTLFSQMSDHPEIQGVRASTIRMIRTHKHLIDRKFRNNKKNNKHFMSLLCHSTNVYQHLQRMNRYGILGQYIPDFGRIIGQMQYDLFHLYTVDQHSLFVVRNLVRFSHPNYSKEFSLCAAVIKKIKSKEILYIAALFHDIAKGRGGDHSVLGAKDAKAFCQRHGLLPDNTELIVWLVKHHLLMSKTAQREDIYDPQTIERFCETVGSTHYLDHIYLLTVADICATNTNLWNSWKDSLLKELYQSSYSYFERQKKHLNENNLILERQVKALKLLSLQGYKTEDRITSLWENFKSSYFLHEPASMIAQHSDAILSHGTGKQPLISILPHHSRCSTEILIYMPHNPLRFAITTTVLSNLQINILEARISTCKNNYDLDTYIILDNQNHTIEEPHFIDYIKHSLTKQFSTASEIPRLIFRRMSRQHRHFNIAPKISFHHDQNRQRSQLLLIAADRPGLLAIVSKTLLEFEILLQNAKISTAGEKVEDVFYITDKQSKPLAPPLQKLLHQRLLIAIGGQV